jgi:uncharacterized membrane-anchored protein
MFKPVLMTVLLAAGLLSAAHAQQAAPATPEQLEAALTYQSGKVTLPSGIATLDLPPSFRYLGPQDAERVLTEGWGNPPGSKSLGMIVPAKVGVLSAEGWGVVITYEKDGHVKDDDADKIDYDTLLKEMQEATVEENKARKEQGFGGLTMMGWAEKPSYDKTSHKLYWAQQIQFDGSPASTLNYNIRVLGREGVLVLNAVAGMDQLAAIRQEMKQVTAFTDFTAGNKYADYNSATDKTAEYGIAALVAGGVASKLGLFGKLLALLLAFKKFIIIGLGALAVWAFKFFGGRSSEKVNLEK